MNTMNVINKIYSDDLFYKNVDLDNLHILSKQIIEDKDCRFSEAYDPVLNRYGFSSNKKKLKDFEIELGIEHKHIIMPWVEV